MSAIFNFMVPCCAPPSSPSVNSDDVLDLISANSPKGLWVKSLSMENVDILTQPEEIGGESVSYEPVSDAGNFSGDRVILANQNTFSQNGIYECRDTGLNKLGGPILGHFYVVDGNNTREVWAVINSSVKRVFSPPHTQTVSAGIAATHTITHNKNTTRPQVKIFDLVTNEELSALATNISASAYDLDLPILANDVEVLTYIPPDF